jgi:hypothetical protein
MRGFQAIAPAVIIKVKGTTGDPLSDSKCVSMALLI